MIPDPIKLLSELIQTPSLSREEEATAFILKSTLENAGCPCERYGNNIISRSKNWKDEKPTVVLCSHHDTVAPNKGYTRDPFVATVEDGKLYGLGSNDAGGCLVSLVCTFIKLYDIDLPFNLLLAAVAEEEISGSGGVSMVLPHLPELDLVIVGEPTLLQMAIAEKGLLVIDGEARGIPGHAAHEGTENPIYTVAQDARIIEQFEFEKKSPLLGETRVSLTMIQAGTQHNQVPAACKFVLDARVNECYTNQEVFELLQQSLQSQLTARSFRLNSSGIPADHPFMDVVSALGLKTFGSSTLSDQAVIPYPSVKIGPGDSTRSHTADEFIYIEEIHAGIDLYTKLITQYQPR